MRKLLSLLGIGIVAIAPGLSVRAEQQKPQPGTIITAGDIRRHYGFYSLVFYFSPKPAVPTEATARELIASRFPELPIITSPESARKPPFIAIETERAPLKNYPVPSASYFKYAGHGLSPEDIAAMQKTDLAFRIILITSTENIWNQTRRFTELALEFAEKADAFIWDSGTRECFSRRTWKEQRLDTWTDTIPRLPDQFTIHVYRVKETNYVRAITLGLEKFALPDLVIQQMLGSETRSGGNLINVTAQLLAENPAVETPATYRVSLPSLKNESLRKNQSTNLLKGATQEARIALTAGRSEEGDPDNRLIELNFRHGDGRSADERRQATFVQIWGAADSLVKITHDDEILAASERAKTKLPELQRRFDKGLAPGERILIKAPFARDDEGNEWMWVEVLKWPVAGKITGILQNNPYHVKKLRAGSRVLIKPEEVFDFMYYKADGTSEGNETGWLMERRNPEVEAK